MSADFTIRIDVSPIEIRLHTSPDHHAMAHIEQLFNSLKEIIMATREEFLGQINDLKTQLDAANATLTKSQGEVTSAVAANTASVAALNAKIAELQAVIDAGGGDIPPEVITAFNAAKESANAVTASASALDALNADTP